MRKNFRNLLTTTAVLAALAGGSILYAYADSPSSPSSGGMMQGGQGNTMGQMGQGNMMGMMNMMGQMSQMMETCNNTMKDMSQHHGPEKPKERENLEQKG